MEAVDITIIGAGITGLAVSYYLSGTRRETVVIEKNGSFGQETSSRNSEVIHAGIYYPKESLKSSTCIRGSNLMYELCSRHNIPHRRIGKLIVAYDKDGLEELEKIYRNARDAGVADIEIFDRSRIKGLEPHVEAERAIFSPGTGILDSHKLMRFLFLSARDKNVNFSFSIEVIGIEKKKDSLYEVTVREPNGALFSFLSAAVINCAGLWADKIAAFAGMETEKFSYKIQYCKGQYFRIRNPQKLSLSHLIYPPPTELDLGIHITPDLAGGLRVGPDARYVDEIDYTVNEKDKEIFFKSAAKFLPDLSMEDLIPDIAGIRAKLQKSTDPFRDFVLRDEEDKGFPNFINAIGIESPGLTSSLAIGELVKDMVLK